MITRPAASTVSRRVSYQVSGVDKHWSSFSIPHGGLLLYLARPNSDEYLVGENTEIGENTFIWGFYAGTDTTIRAATGWVNGNGNALFADDGTPIVALATEIVADSTMTNVAGGQVFFKVTSGESQTGKLAIYAAPLSAEDELKMLNWATA